MTMTELAYVVAVICLALATLGVGLPRVHFGWLGLALVVLVAYVL